MIRRSPTIISLGDEEIQCHLQRIVLRTLPTDFDQLRLDDQDPSYSGDTIFDSTSDGRVSSSQSDGEFDPDTLPDSTRRSSCVEHHTAPTGSLPLAAPISLSASAMTASLRRAPGPNKSPATTHQVSTALPRYRASRPRISSISTSTLTITRRELEHYSALPSQSRKKGLFRRRDDSRLESVIDETVLQKTIDEAAL